MTYRIAAWIVVGVLSIGSMHAYAEQPVHRAFLRGGDTISQALQETKTVEPLLAAAANPSQQKPMAALPATDSSRRNLKLWIGLAITGTIAGILVYKSVKNHGSVFSPRV